MKFENNNKEIIKKITNRSLKSNKTRNIFVVLAIVLTTFMLACVFTLGISFNENYQLMNLRDAGTTANTYLNNPSEKQISEVVLKRIVAATPIKEGEVLSADNMTVKRSTVGLKASLWDLVNGRIATCNYAIDEPIII